MLCLNNLKPIINLPTNMEKKALLRRSFFCTGEDIKETTNSVPKSEQKKRLTNFEYVLSVALQIVDFSLSYVTIIVVSTNFANSIKCYPNLEES